MDMESLGTNGQVEHKGRNRPFTKTLSELDKSRGFAYGGCVTETAYRWRQLDTLGRPPGTQHAVNEEILLDPAALFAGSTCGLIASVSKVLWIKPTEASVELGYHCLRCRDVLHKRHLLTDAEQAGLVKFNRFTLPNRRYDAIVAARAAARAAAKKAPKKRKVRKK